MELTGTRRNSIVYNLKVFGLFCNALRPFYSVNDKLKNMYFATGSRQANLVLIAYASSEGSGESAHPRSLTRTFPARSYKQ